MLSSFSSMVHILNMQYQFEKTIDSGNYQIPKKYNKLTIDSAQWVLEKIHIFNKNNKMNNRLKEICREYLNSIENNYNIEFVLE